MKIKKNYVNILIILAISVIILIPFAFIGKIYNHDDFLFHKARLLNYYVSVSHGNFRPYIFSAMDSSKGYAADLFYPSFSLLPFTLFYFISRNFIVSYYLFLFFVIFLTGIIAYYCGKNILNNSSKGLMFSAIYNLGTYHLIDLFIRGDIGELIMYAFLPVFVVGLLRLYKQQRYGNILVVFSTTIIAYSHPFSILLLFMCVIFFNVFLLLTKKISLIFLLNEFIILGLCLLTCSNLLAPIFEQMIHAKFNFMESQPLWPIGLHYNFSNLLMASLSNNAGVWQNISPNIGPFMLIGITLLWINIKKLSNSNKNILIATTLFFILSSNILIWPFVGKSFLSHIQFEWRLLVFVSILGSLLLADTVNKNYFKYTVFGLLLLSISFNFTVLNNFEYNKVYFSTEKNITKYAPEVIGGGKEYLVKPHKSKKDSEQNKLIISPKNYYYGYKLKIGKKLYDTVKFENKVAYPIYPNVFSDKNVKLIYKKTSVQKYSELIAIISILTILLYYVFQILQQRYDNDLNKLNRFIWRN
ncbi:hypothetical protein GKC31_10070 (plasmid) [Lactobacillus curvatus]|nr:hypothetical protein [Latilactobacillus curvatus]MSD84806.1 hypothetical protein [Latilactobacillus curvatus]